VPTGIRFQAFEFVDRSALSKADYWIKSVNFPGFLAPDGNFWAETGFDLDLRKPEWREWLFSVAAGAALVASMRSA
jgi:hypothetical protein